MLETLTGAVGDILLRSLFTASYNFIVQPLYSLSMFYVHSLRMCSTCTMHMRTTCSCVQHLHVYNLLICTTSTCVQPAHLLCLFMCSACTISVRSCAKLSLILFTRLKGRFAIKWSQLAVTILIKWKQVPRYMKLSSLITSCKSDHRKRSNMILSNKFTWLSISEILTLIRGFLFPMRKFIKQFITLRI